MIDRPAAETKTVICACPSIDADECLERRYPCGCWVEYGTEHAPTCPNFDEECCCACHEERRAELREQEDYENADD